MDSPPSTDALTRELEVLEGLIRKTRRAAVILGAIVLLGVFAFLLLSSRSRYILE